MSFVSFEYFLFLPVVFILYGFFREKFRWLILLVSSLLFYAALGVPYLLGVAVFITLFNYIVGRNLFIATNALQRQLILVFGISVNIGLLCLVKYLGFFLENIALILNFFSSPLKVSTVPIFISIGVSYFIFQAVSYLIDIYLEIVEPETHIGHFALYLLFFPKLLQGPIERAGDLLPQLKKLQSYDYCNVRYGVVLFTIGLFKKVVLAERFAIYADAVYSDVYTHSGLSMLLATYAYALQIYFDFSAYTDMARGTARIFNIDLTENFNRPYLATSVADFWRRWHITFSRWILDYIFKPLQMHWRNAGNRGIAFALLITFLVSGLWHGAEWGFVVWGGIHGIYMAASVFFRPYKKKVYGFFRLKNAWLVRSVDIFVTFNLVCFAWVFFRANSLSDAVFVLGNMFAGVEGLHSYLFKSGVNLGLVVLFLLIYLIFSFEDFATTRLFYKNKLVRWSFYFSIVFCVIFFGIFEESSFIYFQF